jgi:putative PEP-CTERM system histidine kinase
LGLMVKNAARLRDNPEFQEDMLATVESSLEKMRRLMLQLREGETPPSGHNGVDLSKIARRLETVAAECGRRVNLTIVDRLLTRGHEERIERVLGHVLQNALDATAAGDSVWLGIKRYGGQAHVEIGDTGKGMSEDYVKTRLFKPFQTTKSAGMGIGTFESLTYVRELGGSIAVDTELGRGTVMTISLPLFDAEPAAEIQVAAR